MSTTTCPIMKHPETGLLYVTQGNEATIVGCTQPGLTHLDVPPVVIADGVQYLVTAVGESAFAYQGSLQTLRIPERLTSIGQGAFEGSGLTEVHLHDGLKTIAPYAFFGCVHLNSVDLPVSVTLEDQAFGGCDALKQENIGNIAYLSEENLRRAGLPLAAPAGPTIIYVDGKPVEQKAAKSPAEQLLEQGVAFEEAGQYADAAAAYLQAHRLRNAVSKVEDAMQQLTLMKPIATAEYRLALLLKFEMAPSRNPDGTPRPDAAELLRLLVDTSDISDAAYHLGDMYAGGYGLPVDSAAALSLLRSAAEHGHERACLDLGYIYLRGTLAQPNTPLAMRYFAKCAGMNGPYAAIAREEMDGYPLL